MTSQSEISDRVLKCLAQGMVVDASKVDVNASFAELGIDSIDMVNAIFYIEDEFGISIESGQEHSISNIADLVRLVESCLQADGSKGGAP
jgi:acyl carrier protein